MRSPPIWTSAEDPPPLEETHMETILTYDSVDICYRENTVVRNVSFSLRRGEILGIVGASGSGKSTLLRAAMGLLGRDGLVSRGDIWFQGKSLPDVSEREMRRIRGAQIGMVFQDAGASLCPIRTVGSQIWESLSAHGRLSRADARARALAIFEKLRLQDGERIWNSYPFELSGGMSQRVGIAAAMLTSPSILLADEPTSALDVSVRKQVVLELLHLRESFGTAVILTTHDIGAVSAIADTVLVLKAGNTVEYGPAEQILSAPQSAYTRALLSAAPRLRRH